MKTYTSIIITALFLLSGCAGVNTYQIACEKQHSYFPKMVDCLKHTAPDRFHKNSGFRLYLLKAEQLSIDVKSKKISDLEARTKLQELYVALQNNERSNVNVSTSQGLSTSTTECIKTKSGSKCTTK